MKHALFYISVIVLSILLGFILSRMRPSRIPHLLIVDTEYAWVGDGTSYGQVMFFVNDLDHGIADEDHYMRVLLGDEKREKIIEVSLYRVEVGHVENYLGENYHRILVTFKLPHVSMDMIFDQAYLHLECFDQDEYQLLLGRVSIFTPDVHEHVISWTSLEGFKQAYDLRSRLYEIRVRMDGDIPEIHTIDVGSQGLTSFHREGDWLIITIGRAPYLLYDVPIILSFQDGRRHIIASFRYITDYVILKESGPWIHTYELH